MAATTMTAALLTKLLSPVISELFKEAKDQAKLGLAKWATTSGIRKIATTLLKIDKVKTIWSPEEETSLNKIYYPSKITDNKQQLTIENFTDLPEGNLIIEGIVGQGKSIFMRYLAASLVNASPPSKIPAFIELRNITEKRNLSSLIATFFKSISINHSTETFDYLASTGKVVLILDGFDEIPANCVADIILDLQTLHAIHPELKLIISSRPQSHIQNVAGFRVVKLVQLTSRDYEPFISKLITSPAKRQDVIDALHNCASGIKGIINTPLMLTLVVIIYQTEKEIPSTLSAFFDKLFGVVFAKHDRLKAGFNRQHYSGLSETNLKKLFETFCFMTIQHNLGRSMTEAQFNKIFSEAVKFDTELKCKNEDFKKDIISVACLMIEEGLDIRTFLHKSILDYHAAAFIRDLTESQAEKFYAAALTQYSRWEHVLQFLQSIDKLRYTTQYTLKYVPDALSELVAVIDSGDINKLISYIDFVLPEGYMTFVDFHFVDFTRTARESSEFHGAIADQVPPAFFDLCKDLSSEKLSQIAVRNGLDPDAERLMLTSRVLIQELGTGQIISALKTIELTEHEKLRAALKYVQNESKKDDMFIDILATEPPILIKKRKKP